MILLLSLIFICSVWCLGLTILTSEGMLLESVGRWVHERIKTNTSILKALIGCIWCMPSIHTSVAMFFAYKIGIVQDINITLVYYYPLVAMGSSLVSGIVWTFYQKMEAQMKHYDLHREEIEEEYFSMREEDTVNEFLN